MRVMFFSTAFPQPQDPCRSPYNLHRCKALARMHEVVVVSPVAWKDRWTARRSVDQTTLEGLPLWYPTFYYPAGFARSAHAWCLDWSVRRTADDIIRRFRPDVVLSYWTYPDGAAALRMARRAQIPVVALAGGSDVLLVEGQSAPGRRVKRVLESVDAVSTMSEQLRIKICDLGVPPDRVHVLPAAVDPDTFSPGSRSDARAVLRMDQETPVLLWIGRIVEVKGLEFLLGACRDLHQRHQPFRLFLVGDGPDRRRLTELSEQWGLSSCVTFVGRVPQGNLPTWYRAADVTVLPSLSEGTPNVLLESHACGTPFVASAVGAVPRIAVSGLDELVAPGDSKALAQALRESLTRPKRSKRALNHVGGWDETARQLSSILESVALYYGVHSARSSNVFPTRQASVRVE